MRLNVSILLLLSCFCLPVHGGDGVELQPSARGAEPKGKGPQTSPESRRPQTPEDLFRPVQSAEEVDIEPDEQPDLEANAVSDEELARFLWPHVKRRLRFFQKSPDQLGNHASLHIAIKHSDKDSNQSMHAKLCRLYRLGQGEQSDDFDEVVEHYRNEFPWKDAIMMNSALGAIAAIGVGGFGAIFIYIIIQSV